MVGKSLIKSNCDILILSKMSSKKYDYKALAKKWDEKWQEDKIYEPDIDKANKPFYNLMMFPYPSAEGLHVGNVYAFTGTDVYGRFMRMKGYDVFEPIGLDGFGIHSENYALKIGKNPMTQSKISEKRFYEQLHLIGNAFDWTRTVETYKPEYYRWTQWLFIQLFKAGLAEKQTAEVNWCPSCKTVLADEQVLSGECERCGSIVEKKKLEQWFFKITKYADRLLTGLSQIDWTEKVKLAQKNWIGKSEGAKVKFQIKDQGDFVEVFTTRPDTLHGATFLVLSPQHPLVEKLIASKESSTELKNYIERARNKSVDDLEKDKTGVFSGLFAVNPVNKEEIPVWVADYVLMSYGTGAIMAVPAHDRRDWEFAKKYELDIKQVISVPEQAKEESECYAGRGQLISSGEWTGWDSVADFHKILDFLESKNIGKKETRYHLRDWLISRQRYWGVPIPMVFCEKDGWQPVSEDDLPVLLPYVKDFKPLGTGVAPLAQDAEFITAKCPKCGDEARRETDVCDTFLDSSWYFLRYPSADVSASPFDDKRTKKWLPVHSYIGGAEHSVLHLLYSRFICYALHDLGFIDFEEPFTKFRAHGLLIKDGSKMSKSKGNVVNPDQYIEKFGTDTLRCYLMFIGPFSEGGDFRDSGIEGMERFLKRVLKLVHEVSGLSASEYQLNNQSAKKNANSSLDKSEAKAVKDVSEEVESLRYNTALAKIMEYVNDLNRSKPDISSKQLKTLSLLLAPFAPYLAEEMWEMLDGGGKSVHKQPWPSFNEEMLEKDEVTVAVQINGKLRSVIKVASADIENHSKVEEMARADGKVIPNLQGKSVKKVVYIKAKVINFVVN